MSRVGNKRGREIEDENEERATKKLKYDECDITTLPEELLMQILVRVPKKNIDTLSEVSSQWRQITRSRNFWKTSCQLKWTTIVATDTSDFDREEYLVPIVKFNDKILVDWQFYYKLRTKFGKAMRAVAKYIGAQESFDDELSETVAEIVSMGDELHHGTVSKFLGAMPFLSVGLDRAQFANFVVPVVDVICDIALLRYKRDELDWLKPTVSLLEHLVENKKPQAKLFSLCKRAFDLCLMVRDKQPNTISLLVLIMARLFRAITPLDDRSKKLFTLFTEYLIQLGPLDLGKAENAPPALVFRHPFSVQDNEGIVALQQYCKINESSISTDIAIRLYYTSDDWKVKASAVAVGYRPLNITQEYMAKYIPLAVDAAKQSEQELAFSGIVGLYKLVGRGWTYNMQFSAEQAAQIFELFTDAFTRYDASHGLNFYNETLLEILTFVESESISDELLDRFIVNVLDMFTQLPANAVAPEEHCVYAFSRIGTVFKRRLASKLESIKAVLFDLVPKRFKPTKILLCYVDLGAAVLEDDFAPEFRKLAKQIVDGTLPFKTTATKCYARFADVWLRYAESDEERETIVKAMLEAIPKEVYSFGQSRVFIEANVKEEGPEGYPKDLVQLLKDYECKDSIPKRDMILSYKVPPNHVPKDQLTPVNPTDLVRADNGDGIKLAVAESYLYASQLQLLVLAENSKYAKHAQTVLNALLGTFRIVLNRLSLHNSILSLLTLVRPEMEPSEFLKYTEIVLCTIGRDVDTRVQVDQKGMANLFTFCIGSLHTEVPKVSTIKHVINAYLTMYDFSTKKFLPIEEFICYCITKWPKNTYEGIRQSKLPEWIMRRIKEATSLDQMAPFMNVFATTAVFYGMDFVSYHMCVDDPEAPEYEPSEKYLERIMPHCRALYEAGTKGTIAMGALELKYLRNFLILYAMYLVDDHSGEISMLNMFTHYEIEVLSNVIASEKSFDTGVPELNDLFIRLDVKGLCSELSLTPDYGDFLD